MINEHSIFEHWRQIENKLIEKKIEQGIEVKYDYAHGLNKGEKGAYFKYKGKWINAMAVIKMSQAFKLPDENFKQFTKTLGNLDS